MTLVEGDQKAPFSIAATPSCMGGATPFSGLLRFTIDAYLILMSVKQRGINTIFKVFGMTRPGIEHRSPGPLAKEIDQSRSGCYTKNEYSTLSSAQEQEPHHRERLLWDEVTPVQRMLSTYSKPH